MAWFQLVADGDPLNPADYNPVTSPGCSGSNYICAIQANPDASNQPVITTSLRNEMITALNTNSNSENVHLRANP